MSRSEPRQRQGRGEQRCSTPGTKRLFSLRAQSTSRVEIDKPRPWPRWAAGEAVTSASTFSRKVWANPPALRPKRTADRNVSRARIFSKHRHGRADRGFSKRNQCSGKEGRRSVFRQRSQHSDAAEGYFERFCWETTILIAPEGSIRVVSGRLVTGISEGSSWSRMATS